MPSGESAAPAAGWAQGLPVARIAADVAHAYPDASVNLTCALRVLSADPPALALAITDPVRRAAMDGYGIPHRARALSTPTTART